MMKNSLFFLTACFFSISSVPAVKITVVGDHLGEREDQNITMKLSYKPHKDSAERVEIDKEVPISQVCSFLYVDIPDTSWDITAIFSGDKIKTRTIQMPNNFLYNYNKEETSSTDVNMQLIPSIIEPRLPNDILMIQYYAFRESSEMRESVDIYGKLIMRRAPNEWTGDWAGDKIDEDGKLILVDAQK